METPLEVLLRVVHLLDEQGIAYVVVGSLASSARGIPRATVDADIVADITPAQVPRLVSSLQNDFYIDELAVRRAVEGRRSFNAIHFDSAFKVDFFVPSEEGVGRLQLARRQLERVTPEVAEEFYVATAEDTVLAKLLWFKSGGAVSERQWSDVAGVIKVQGARLDLEYLREWADRLDVRDVLERALGESGVLEA
jgi:hypothetical protein